MLDRPFLKKFFRWLEAAPLPELIAKREELQKTEFSEAEVKRDAQFLLRHLNREILSRQLFGSSNKV